MIIFCIKIFNIIDLLIAIGQYSSFNTYMGGNFYFTKTTNFYHLQKTLSILPDNPPKLEFSLVSKSGSIVEFHLQLWLNKAVVIQILKFLLLYILVTLGNSFISPNTLEFLFFSKHYENFIHLNGNFEILSISRAP